jgi:hypothetical protein
MIFRHLSRTSLPNPAWIFELYAPVSHPQSRVQQSPVSLSKLRFGRLHLYPLEFVDAAERTV